MMKRRYGLTTFCLALVIGLAPGAAHAQGRGRPKIPHAPATTNVQSTASATSSPAAPVFGTAATTSFRQFGSWLDDASVSLRGEGYTSIGFGYWRMAGTSQTDVPTISGGVGVTDRMQVSASVPFYATSYEGATSRGVDDVYVGAKYAIVDPTLTVSEIGLAVSPVLEILGDAPGNRLHAAIPVSVELRRTPFRWYASGGYFTRGSVFSGGAVEWSSARGVVLTGSLTQSYSIKGDLALDQAGISRRHADMAASLGYPLAQRVTLSMSLGRTLTSIEQGGTSLALGAGATFRFASR